MPQTDGLHAMLKAHFDASGALLPVDFALHAPQAQAVYLIGEMTQWREAKLPMKRGADGVWRLRLNLRKGQWVYKFEVDGEWIADPSNPLAAEDGIGLGACHSYLFVGDGDWTPRPEQPQGCSVEMSFSSRRLGRRVPFTVYYPPAFDRRRDYPLLVLMHGHEIRANQWPTNGCLSAYMDNLSAAGVIEPFIVLMPSGHHDCDMSDYGYFLANELLPWLPDYLPIFAEARFHALAGMSIAGYGPLALALEHPSAFGLIAPVNEIFSDRVIQTAATLAARTFRLHLYCTREGCAYPRYETLVQALRCNAAPIDYMRVTGAPTWRHWNALTPELLLTVSRYFRQPPGGSTRPEA